MRVEKSNLYSLHTFLSKGIWGYQKNAIYFAINLKLDDSNPTINIDAQDKCPIPKFLNLILSILYIPVK